MTNPISIDDPRLQNFEGPLPGHGVCVVCLVGNHDVDHDPADHQAVGFHAADGVPTSEPCPGVEECPDCQDVMDQQADLSIEAITELPPPGEPIRCPYAGCQGTVVEQDLALRWNELYVTDGGAVWASTGGDFEFTQADKDPFICQRCLRPVEFEGDALTAITVIEYD
jgi:hypothetical protein